MKKAELKKLLSEYRLLRSTLDKKRSRQDLAEKMRAIEHRYYHETGERLILN